ncbi:MAG: hypothetical protein U0V48_16685 [Anaerolineales bacterium]
MSRPSTNDSRMHEYGQAFEYSWFYSWTVFAADPSGLFGLE